MFFLYTIIIFVEPFKTRSPCKGCRSLIEQSMIGLEIPEYICYLISTIHSKESY